MRSSIFFFILTLFLSFSVSASNIVINGNFESDKDGDSVPDGWRLRCNEGATASIDSGYKGGKSVKFTTHGAPESVFLTQHIGVEPYTDYLLIMYYKTDSGSPSPGYPFVTPEYSFFYDYAYLRPSDGKWARLEEKKNSGSKGSLKFNLILWHQSGSVWFDNVRIYKSPLKVEIQADEFQKYNLARRFETQGRVSLIEKGRNLASTRLSRS